MPLVHLEHVVRGREHQCARLGIGEDHGLEHVHRLGDVGHDQAAGVAVEDVEVQPGHEGVAQRVLLVEEAGVGARLDIPPGAPLVQHQAHVPARVVAVHDVGVAGEQLVHPGRLHHRAVVVVGAEVRGLALVLPGTGERVVVHRQRLHERRRAVGAAQLAELLHQRLGPGVVEGVGSRRDPVELVVAVVTAVGAEPAGLGGVLRGAHVAAAAPRLVAEPPEAHPPRLLAPVLLAQPHHRRVAVAGEVFDPVAHLPDRARADVAADVRLRPEQLAQGHELVRAEVVVLLDVAPVGVDHDRAPVLGPDAVRPVVFVGEAAAWPAQVGDVQGAQRLDHVQAQAALVRQVAVLAHVEPAVDTPAQVLGEVPVQVPVDHGTGDVDVDDGGDGTHPGLPRVVRAS